jgi:hypothetical protein
MRLSQTEAHPRDTILTGSGEDTIVGEFELFGMTQPISGETKYSYTGETEVLAGDTLARIAFVGSVTMPPPMEKIEGTGTLLYSDKLDFLIEEEVRFDFGAGPETHRLKQLALPGQSGFGDETPGYGCGELSLMSGANTEAPT